MPPCAGLRLAVVPAGASSAGHAFFGRRFRGWLRPCPLASDSPSQLGLIAAPDLHSVRRCLFGLPLRLVLDGLYGLKVALANHLLARRWIQTRWDWLVIGPANLDAPRRLSGDGQQAAMECCVVTGT